MAHDALGERLLRSGVEVRLRPGSKGLPDDTKESTAVLDDSIRSALSLIAFYKQQEREVLVWVEEGRFEKALRSRAWTVKSTVVLSGTPPAEGLFSGAQEEVSANESRGFSSGGMRLTGWR